MTLDLNDEEFEECLSAYLTEFKNSRQGYADELYLRIRLKSIGLDSDEITLAIANAKGV